MSKKPLYPHVPQKREPLFPHKAKANVPAVFETKPSLRTHKQDVDDVLRGIKPAALVDAAAARYAESVGLVIESVPTGTFQYLAARLAYVVYRPGEPENAERIFEIFAQYPIGQRGEEWHRKLGRALGYSTKDIDDFIRRFRNGQEPTTISTRAEE